MVRFTVATLHGRPSDLSALLGLAKVNALLARMMMLSSISTVTADMRRSLLALLSTVLALRHRPSFLGNGDKLAVWSFLSAELIEVRSYIFATNLCGCIR